MSFPRAAVESQLSYAGTQMGSGELDISFATDISLASGGETFPQAFSSFGNTGAVALSLS